MAATRRSLTQEEAVRRAGLLQVHGYDIAVDLTDLPTGPAVRCTSTIDFGCAAPGAETFLDCRADLVSATLNGDPLHGAEDGRIALAGLEADNRVVVETVQANTREGAGVHKAVDAADGNVYLWMSFEPDEAQDVWACFDQPDLKAPHTFTVTAPTSWTVLSNSAVEKVEDVDDNRRWHFAPTPPLSTYNPVVLAGPFHELRRQVDGHDLGLYTRQSLAAQLDRDAEGLFTVTAQGLAFFAEAFGMPFPQEKYDQAFVPEMGGAMENYGCVTWSDALLTRVPPTPAEQEMQALVLVHEMAHMWFGNIVTMRWWEDLWLNEAFAEFAANWALVNATRFTDAWAHHLAGEKQSAYLVDKGPRSHPIRQPVPDVAAAAASFDAITYPKGASVLDQLRTYVGEKAFRRGMAAYFRAHAWGNTTLQDLIAALAEASGRDLDTWRQRWLDEAGTDLLSLERAGSSHTVVATPAPGTTAPRPHVLSVGAYRRGDEGLTRIGRTTVEVSGERTPVELPEAELYLLNDDDLTFARTRPEEPEHFLALAPELPTVLGRGVAVATARDMLDDGETTAAAVVECLTRLLGRESAPTCVEPYLRLVTDVAELWSPGQERPEHLRAVAEVCREFLDRGEHNQVARRFLSRVGDADDLAALEDAAAADMDLRWRIQTRRTELGAGVDDDMLEQLQRSDPDPDSWVRALAVRAAAPSEVGKAAAWEAMIEERRVPISSVGMVAAAFWRPGQDDLLAPYAERYLDAVPTMAAGGMIPAMVYANRLFPLFGIGPEYVDRAVAASQGAAPIVRGRLEERADEVRRMLASRG